MTKAEILTRINSKCGNGSYTRFNVTEVISALNEGLRELSLGSSLYLQYSTLTLVTDTGSYTKPDLNNIVYCIYNEKPVKVLTGIKADSAIPGWRSSSYIANHIQTIVEENGNLYIIPRVNISSTPSTLTLVSKRIPTEVLEADADIVNIDANDLYINTLIYYVASILLMQSGRSEDNIKSGTFMTLYIRGLKSANSDTQHNISSVQTNTPFN